MIKTEEQAMEAIEQAMDFLMLQDLEGYKLASSVHNALLRTIKKHWIGTDVKVEKCYSDFLEWFTNVFYKARPF